MQQASLYGKQQQHYRRLGRNPAVYSMLVVCNTYHTPEKYTESTSLAHVTDIKLVSVKFYWKFLHSTLDQSRNAPGFTKLDTAFTQTSYRQMDRVLHSYTN